MNRDMTPAQRAKAVYRSERPDRVPFTVYESKVVGKPFEDQVRSSNICLLRRVVSWRTVTPNVKARQETDRLPNGHVYQRTILETPLGCLSCAVEKAEGIDIDTTWKKERLFKDADDYSKLRFLYQDMVVQENDQSIADSVRLDQENRDVIVRDTIGSEPMQELISDIMGVETFSYEWMDNRDEIEALLAIMSERSLEKARIVAASPLGMANYGGNVTPQIIGRDAYIQHYMARYAEAYDLLHRSGKLMGVHLDGANAPIMDLIAQSKMDYVEAYDPSMSPSVRQAMQTFPDKVLSINWPSALQLGTRDEIKQATTDILVQVTDFSRFIMGVTEDIPAWKFAENILAIADALACWGRLT
jgi:hypothetical protein